MTMLLFTADGLLREQTPGAEPRVLSRIVERPGERARMLAGEHRYEIVPSAQTGWGFELRDGEGAPGGGFQPFRLRCGGRLRVRDVAASLHGRPWSHEGWAFSLPDGRKVEATVRSTVEITSNGDRVVAEAAAAEAAARAPADAASFVVVLEAAASLQPLALAEVLALGSWLIGRWHVTPAADHVLAAAGAATGLASGSATSAPAGIRAQTAN
jgi:hypothetical protein